MGLISDCELCFGTKCLYEVLSLDKTASDAELKKSFKKASLLCHPDKVEESKKDEATRKFQVLAKVHYLLSDKEKRAIYDETGIVDDENVLSADNSSPDFWNNYFRNLFPKITEKQIVDYVSKYKGSEEEKHDLIELYNKYEGDWNKMSQCLIAYDVDEEERYCQILKDLIEEDEIPSYPKFVNESSETKAKRHKKEKRMKKKEAEELEEMAASDALVQALARRQIERKTNFDDMISGLEAKYGKKDSGKKKRKA